MIEAIQAGLTAACLFVLAISLAVCVALAIGPRLREVWRNYKRLKVLDRAVVAVGLISAIAYGGTKPHHVPNAGADDGIALIGIDAEYDSTNDVTAVEVSFTGNNVTTTTPVSVRNSQTENWRELVKIGATVTSDFATNVLAFAVAGNVATNRFWWVGTETPAVIIETTGIEITYFAASSSSVQIMWLCDDPNATEFIVQRRRKNAAQWETVAVTSSFAFVYVGFTVGETWEWQVTSTYTEGD